jgi:hypothetical protein
MAGSLNAQPPEPATSQELLLVLCHSLFFGLDATGKRGQVPKMQSTPWAVPVFGT